MHNLQKLLCFAMFNIFLFPLNLMAENNAEINSLLTVKDFQEKDKELKTWCEQNPLVVNVKVFKDARIQAETLRKEFCNNKVKDYAHLQARTVDLLGELKILFPDSNQQSKLFLETLRKDEWVRVNATGEVAQFEVLDDSLLAISLDSSEPHKIQNDLLDECNTSAKLISSDIDCEYALKEFELIYNFAHSTLAQPIAYKLSERLSELEKEWDDFYNRSKSQTIWELALNGYFFQQGNKAGLFSEPPGWQLVFIHPTIVVENVSDAIDGDELKEAVMIEVIGADWWNQRKWFLPSGGEIITTYSDRSGVDDWGYGVALNFNSKFTMGASDHGGDIGVFITIDFLKLLQDKATTIKKIRGSLDF